MTRDIHLGLGGSLEQQAEEPEETEEEVVVVVVAEEEQEEAEEEAEEKVQRQQEEVQWQQQEEEAQEEKAILSGKTCWMGKAWSMGTVEWTLGSQSHCQMMQHGCPPHLCFPSGRPCIPP